MGCAGARDAPQKRWASTLQRIHGQRITTWRCRAFRQGQPKVYWKFLAGSQGVDLLPTFRSAPKGFRTAASWILSTDLRLKVGFASASHLLLLGLYNMSESHERLAFMVTTEQEALQGLVTTKPGLLIVTHPLNGDPLWLWWSRLALW